MLISFQSFVDVCCIFPVEQKPFHRFEKTVLPVGRNKRNFHAAIMLRRIRRVLIEK
jgi:hypothetical protein